MRDEWTVHFRTEDGLVHIADVSSARAWCRLRCDGPDRERLTAKGDVDLPVTCLPCLAEVSRYQEPNTEL
jgi:hypothetical protein